MTLRHSLLIAGVVVCAAWSARADDIVNTGGFEPPFSTVFGGTGQLEGQVNPPGQGQLLPPGQWIRTSGLTSSAVVQTGVVAPDGGAQAVRVDRAANDTVGWAVPVGHLDRPHPAQPLIHIGWDMRVEQAGGPIGAVGPFFGVEAFDDAAFPIGLLGSLGVDATTGQVLYQAAGSGFLIPTGTTVSFGQWNRFDILLDYGADQYTVYCNLVPLATGGFVDPGLDRFTRGTISALSAAGDPASQALTGTAYYDNFRIRDGAVPAPSSLALLMLGGVAQARRRRSA